jgi:hypothetical protein
MNDDRYMNQSSQLSADLISMMVDSIVLSMEFLEILINNKYNGKGHHIKLIPVSLANITGGPECASAKCRVRGYFVLLKRCNTMHMRPASTAIPVETPSRVGISDVMLVKSER